MALASLTLTKFGRGSGWTQGLEGVFLAIFAGLWLFLGGSFSSITVYGLIILSAVAMGLQGGIGRAIGAPGIMTVIFTSTSTAIISNLVERVVAGHRPLITTLTTR